jgi:hypothetical protein
MTASQIIELLGGVTAVSRHIGVPLTTVSSWGRWNQIPTWRQPEMLRLAAAQGKSLSTTDFPAPEDRKLRDAAA